MRSLLYLFLLFFSVCLQASPKLLVLVIANDEEPIYVEDQKIWRSYMHQDPENVRAYFVKARTDLEEDVLVEEDTIWVKGERIDQARNYQQNPHSA